MKKLFILSVLTLGLLSMRSQDDLSKLKEGIWQLYIFPTDGEKNVMNGLYTMMEIKVNGDIADIKTATIKNDNTYGMEDLQLKLNEPFISKSPSGRKSVTVLSYDNKNNRFLLERKYYTKDDESKLEFTMYEQLWYDENGEANMSRKCDAVITDYGARDYEYTGKYRQVRVREQ